MMLLVGCSKTDSSEAADAALKRGLALHVDGKLPEASEAYQVVLKHDKRNKYAIYNLGLIDQTENRPTAAAAKYRLVLNIDPDYQPALFNLAIIEEKLGRFAEALELYHRAVAVAPGDAKAHRNLGLLLRAQGRTAEGDAEIAKADQLEAEVSGTTTPSNTEPGSPSNP